MPDQAGASRHFRPFARSKEFQDTLGRSSHDCLADRRETPGVFDKLPGLLEKYLPHGLARDRPSGFELARAAASLNDAPEVLLCLRWDILCSHGLC